MTSSDSEEIPRSTFIGQFAVERPIAGDVVTAQTIRHQLVLFLTGSCIVPMIDSVGVQGNQSAVCVLNAADDRPEIVW